MVKENLPTNSVRDEEIKLGISDHKGGIYSADFKRLLKFDESKREKGLDEKEKAEYIIDSQCETICDYAFNGCYFLKRVDLTNVKYIGRYAFFGCMNLKEVSTSRNDVIVEYVGKKAFQHCTKIEEIEFPSKLFTIEEGVFCECSSLRHVHNLETVHTINREAFADCCKLQDFVFPDYLTTIGESAFEGCDCLQEVVLPEFVRKICSRAFANCGNLKKFTIGNTKAEIAADAFVDCPRLQWRNDNNNINNVI